MIPDDTAGPPLTPGEQAAIADLERRLLLDGPVPVRDREAVPPVRTVPAGARRGPSGARRGPAGAMPASVPLVALLGIGLLLVALLAATGGGVLGGVAVLVSIVATALVWPLLPAGLGGPVRPPRRPYRTPGQIRGRR